MNYFNLENLDSQLQAGAALIEEYMAADETAVSHPVTLYTRKREQGLSVHFENNTAWIEYSRPCTFYRGLGLVKEWMEQGENQGQAIEQPEFSHLTYMADCSRNAVCSMDFLKNLMVTLALMGYDRMMLYTEDTYEVEGYPYFGHFRGRYSKNELKELDAFAAALGMELVPCIQTLAHLNAIFRWPAFHGVHDTGDILLCQEENTYALIDAMVRTWSETCKSRIINIGMDEAEMIGRGAFLSRFGYRERFEIMESHLRRVLEICEKYGYTCLMWSDMFFKIISGGKYYGKEFHITEDIKSRIPQNVELLYWDYYSRDEDTYDRMMKYHRELSPSVGFAGGAWKWNGYAPLLHHSMMVSRMALRQCSRHGISNILVTGWGDDGGEASQACVLPVLCLFAEYNYAQNMDTPHLTKRLKACAGADLADFMKLDLPNLIPGNESPGKMAASPARYLLYQDVLLGIYDAHVDVSACTAHYRKCAQELTAVYKKGGHYAYLFRTLALLCEVMEQKAGLGVLAKEAYDREDRATLLLLSERCAKTAGLTENFRQALTGQWCLENKCFGLEVLDIRLGGLKERLHSASKRLMDYAEGKLSCLEELEEPRLPLSLEDSENKSPVCENIWKEMVSASVI